MFAGRSLPNVGEAIATVFVHHFKSSTKWPNKKELVNLGQQATVPLSGTGLSSPLATSPILVSEPEVGLNSELSEFQGTADNEIFERNQSFQGELESKVDVSSTQQMLSLHIQGPLKNNTKVVSGSPKTHLKDFMKLVMFSFGIDAKNADRYELVARHGQNFVEMRKYTTLGKVQNFLDTHEGATLSVRRKSESARSESMDRGRVESDGLKQGAPEESKVNHRKRSNSFS